MNHQFTVNAEVKSVNLKRDGTHTDGVMTKLRVLRLWVREPWGLLVKNGKKLRLLYFFLCYLGVESGVSDLMLNTSFGHPSTLLTRGFAIHRRTTEEGGAGRKVAVQLSPVNLLACDGIHLQHHKPYIFSTKQFRNHYSLKPEYCDHYSQA